MLKVVSNFVNAIGAVNYKGTWNAATNNPALASGVGVKGDYYVVGTAGTTTIDGISTWYVGDWIVFNGTVWQRVQGGSDDPAPSLLSNSSTGLMQITGPGAGTTRVVTIPNANSTMARTDAAQSFTGDQTLATGNLIQGTAAKGVNFTANTPAAGKTSQLMNWYEEGTWTPSDGSGAGLTLIDPTGKYTRIGRLVTVTFTVVYPATANVNTATISGLPFAASGQYTGACMTNKVSAQTYIGNASTSVNLYTLATLDDYKNSAVSAGTIIGTITYMV